MKLQYVHFASLSPSLFKTLNCILLHIQYGHPNVSKSTIQADMLNDMPINLCTRKITMKLSEEIRWKVRWRWMWEWIWSALSSWQTLQEWHAVKIWLMHRSLCCVVRCRLNGGSVPSELHCVCGVSWRLSGPVGNFSGCLTCVRRSFLYNSAEIDHSSLCEAHIHITH